MSKPKKMQRSLPKFNIDGLDQRRTAWYLELIKEGYSQAQIAEYEGITPQTINFRIKNHEGIFINSPVKGSRIRRELGPDTTTIDAITKDLTN